MVKKRKSGKGILAALNVEMGQPHITASALAAMREGSRKLEYIDRFHGHACSKCGCRFPETKPDVPKHLSVAQTRRLYAIHRKREFGAHACTNPRIAAEDYV
jgi:hypothetical protein